MGAAISIFVLLSLSVFIIRVASVALRLTGLEESQARFQSLSAFTGTGFTTSEAEMIVNYPVRRRIVGLLMVIGNLGLVSVLATLVTSLVNTEGDPEAVFNQLTLMLGGLVMLWVLMLNPVADRLLCATIGRILKATTLLGQRRFHRLLQLGDGYSICEHRLPNSYVNEGIRSVRADLADQHLTLLATLTADGETIVMDVGIDHRMQNDDRLILAGTDRCHETF